MNNLLDAVKLYFPNLDIKYKNESLFMKILSKILFFNKSFMDAYTTTIGSSIYFPNKNFVDNNYYKASLILLHELVHVYDSNKFGQIFFSCLYLSPQIFAILAIPLFFVSWKLALLTLFLFALPIPSFFRMYFEKRAYIVSLYALNYLINNNKINYKLELSMNFYLSNFKNSNYYFMWPFTTIDSKFAEALILIKQNKKPFEDPIFEMIDHLLTKI